MNRMVLTSFTDLFKKSILDELPQEVDPLVLLITLAAGMLIGIGIFLVYRRCFTGVVYDHSFNVSLVVMTILVAIIIVTISSNITLSLGMVGALSIVRYRTAVKNAMDLMFMFWAITMGIAIGANYYYIAAIGFVVVALTFLLLRKWKGDNATYMLIVTYESDTKLEEKLLRSLHTYKGKVRSKVAKREMTELTLEMHLKHDNTNVTSVISKLEGVNDVTLVQYKGSYE